MKRLDELFDWLNALKITWWPFPLPPRDQPLPMLVWLQCSLFHAFLPWMISVTALMGGIYFPSFFLVNSLPHGLFSALLLAIFWGGLSLMVRLPNYLFWNRRAARLSGQEGQGSGLGRYSRPLVQFGLPPILSRTGQQRQTFLPESPLNYQGWNPFKETVLPPKIPLLPALFYGSLLASTLLMLGLVFVPTLLFSICRDLQTLTPALTSLPRPLRVEAQTHPLGKRLCCIGYHSPAPHARPVHFSFELPWDQVTVGELKDFVSVCSREGKCLFFEKTNRNHHGLIQLKALTPSTRFQQIRYRAAHPKTALDLDTLRETLEATPSSLTPLTPPWQSFPAFGRLLNKLFLLGSTSQLYRFKTDDFRGFQLGDPGREKWVQLIIFDTDQRWFSMNIGTQERAKTRITQQEINLILKSLAPSSQEQTAHVSITPGVVVTATQQPPASATPTLNERVLGTTLER
jgi:hypothetical protein